MILANECTPAAVGSSNDGKVRGLREVHVVGDEAFRREELLDDWMPTGFDH